MQSNVKRRNWAYIFSPCVILAILCAVMAVIYVLTPGEHGRAYEYAPYAVFLILPCLIISLLIDFIIRFFLKKVRRKVLYIWGIEAILIIVVFTLLSLFVTL